MKPKLLKATLYVIGGWYCLAGPALLMPSSWWRAMAEWFLEAEALRMLWPEGPVLDYAVRGMMAGFLWLGVILLLAATNPEKHRAQVDIAIGGLFLLALVTLVAGIVNGIPAWWFLGDAIPSLVGALLLLVLRPGKA